MEGALGAVRVLGPRERLVEAEEARVRQAHRDHVPGRRPATARAYSLLARKHMLSWVLFQEGAGQGGQAA